MTHFSRHSIKPHHSNKLDVTLLLLSLGLSHAVMAEPKLDLSIPGDILANEKTSLPESGSLIDSAGKNILHSPEHVFYVENANEKILRRLNAVPAQDQFGKQICGKINYRAKVRPDGTLDMVEVMPVEQTDNYESKVKVYSNHEHKIRVYPSPTPSFQDAKEVSRLDTFTSDDDEIRIFVDTMTQAIHAAAPFPPYPKDVREGSAIQKTKNHFILIYGTFWRECHGWTPPKKTNLQ